VLSRTGVGSENEQMPQNVEKLWPEPGFTVRAFERRLGEGTLTVTDQSLFFEAKGGDTLGFDLTNLRIVKLRDIHDFDVAYSISGELKSASLKVVMTSFPSGAEMESFPPWDDMSRKIPERKILFRMVTGGVAARFLADHSNARLEGLTRMSTDKFDARIEDMKRNLRWFPTKEDLDKDYWSDEQMKELDVVDELQSEAWNDPARVFSPHLPTLKGCPHGPTERFLDKLESFMEDWASGKLGPAQRAVADALLYIFYKIGSERAYLIDDNGSSDDWKKFAQELLTLERELGIDLVRYASPLDPSVQ
jgi:hypothetical protein